VSSTRQYARSLEPLSADVITRGTSKSAVSRRFVAQTQAQLDAWRAPPLDALDLAVLLIDGVHVGGHCIVVALGIDKTGATTRSGCGKAPRRMRRVCQGLLTNFASRGLRTDRSLHETATSRRQSVYCRTWRGAWTLTTRSAAASVREGLDETLTVLGLGLLSVSTDRSPPRTPPRVCSAVRAMCSGM